MSWVRLLTRLNGLKSEPISQVIWNPTGFAVTSRGSCFTRSAAEKRAGGSRDHPKNGGGGFSQAARGYDLIELEAERDLGSDLMNCIPPERRLIFVCGSPAGVVELRDRIQKITATPARLYKLSPTAGSASDGLTVLTALRSIDRRDVIAFATGQAGLWSRLLAPHFGAPFVFGVVGSSQGGLGEPTIAQLIEDYGLPSLPHLGALYGIVAVLSHTRCHPVCTSAYQALGFPGLFVPFQEEFPRLLARHD